ncbi:MAG: imidazolonepropionase [Candidatus Dadabacteria bacterium]|nr:MAG: imidazolonepropionase [Candidatus Dadabacteria bacterium]
MGVLKNIGTLACCRESGGQSDIHIIKNAAVCWDGNGIITFAGPETDLPNSFQDDEIIDAGGMLVTPGLIDCHTHLAFGGWREEEFEKRILGKSYLEIAREGGGILSTVKATRAATEEELLKKCEKFAAEILSLGVTTIECKSGYGLDYANEIKLLNVYKRLSTLSPLTIVSTFLGAHTIPPEFKENRAAYIKLLTEKLIPEVAEKKLALFCDVFVEDTAFSVDEARAILNSAKAYGLSLKLHVDQITNCGGTLLAAELGAASADHLECIDENGISALKASGTVAVALPFASLYTHQKPLNARKLIEAGVPVAVATDFNPGSAPSFHLPFAMTLACTMNYMTPAEVLKGATIYAAKALKLEDKYGSIEEGKLADLAVFEAESVNHWLYHVRANGCRCLIKNGLKLASGN